MKSAQQLLELSHGKAVSLQNPPYMKLCVEKIGQGPNNLPAISVAHYGEQNGDLMRDPDVCFEVQPDGKWKPYSYRNDYTGIWQEVYVENKEPNLRLQKSLEDFCQKWDRNIIEQEYVEEFKAKNELKELIAGKVKKEIPPLTPNQSQNRGFKI